VLPNTIDNNMKIFGTRRPQNLSRAALDIVENRPVAWEYCLFAQVIIDEIEELRRKHLLGAVYEPRYDSPFSVFDLRKESSWIPSRLDEFLKIVAELKALLTSSKEQEKAFGPPGKPGNAYAIVSLSRRIASYYRNAMGWSTMVRHASADPRAVALLERLASLADIITSGLDEAAYGFRQQIEDALNIPLDQRPSITFVPEINIPDTLVEGVIEAMNQLHATIFGDLQPEVSVDQKAGYLYLLINPSMEGLVKIGKTLRNARDRAKELGAATGVPTPFILVFDVYVDDCSKAEEYVHRRLEEKGSRVSNNREFFRVPTHEAVKIMLEAQQFVAG
jgi:hypothetical protein